MSIKFARGTEAMEQADRARSGGNRFTPYLGLKPGEKKYIQFLTPLDEIPGALLHQFIVTAYNEKGEPSYANFISPRDKAIDGPSASDPIQDKFDINPAYRLFAVGVEMEPETKNVSGRKKIIGFEPAMREWTDKDDEVHEVPVAGIVIQAKGNFFSHLQSWEEETDNDMTSVIWSVSRDENKKQPTYSFVDTTHEAIDVSDFAEELPDLDAFLNEIADQDRLHALIDPLDEDFPVTTYPRGKKGSKDKDEKPARRRSSKAAKAEPEAEPEEEFESNEEKAERKTGKLSRLRQKIEEPKDKEPETDDD